MFNLTPEERRAILFLISVALTGLALNFLLKTNTAVGKLIKLDERAVKIGLNQASYEDLVSSRLVTPKLAQKIIEYRRESGPFREIRDLKNIKGIGDYRYEKLKELFYVE